MKGLFVVVVLIAMLVSQSIAQLYTFSPEFAQSRYYDSEGSDLSVRLSASVLTSIPITFTGSIEVDVTAEDLPGGATFGTDYLVNLQNPSSRIFTVSFLPMQANSTEHIMQLANDIIFEGTESFGLQIVETRFSGQAANFLRADDTLNNAFAEVNIADDDFVEVNFTISQLVLVTEGDGVEVRLRGEAFGIYASPIEIGVICEPVQATGVAAAFPNQDFNFTTTGTRIRFTDVDTIQSLSSNVLVVPIINDDIAEPCKSFICTLQGDALDAVRGIEPNQVTIRICDDDELVVRWATDFYEFGESAPAIVQLVTDSVFESATVRIQGFPRHITGAPPRLPSISVCGPRVPGLNFNAGIEQVSFRQGVFGNAQVTQSGRTDVVNTINDFIFTPTSKSALENFTIVDDDVLEFDEILIAEFDFGPEIANTWNVIKGEPSIAFIVIRDDDAVEVNFNENNYTVAESAVYVSMSLHINGQFFFPVWAVVEIIDGTATDPEDYSSAKRYNVTFCQSVFTDEDYPAPFALSSPIIINITNDGIAEGVEYFQAQIVETSYRFRVRIGQDTINVTITDNVIPRIQYEEEWYRVQEEAGYVTLALVLEGNTSVPVTVTVRTLDLQDSSAGAAATGDYIPKGPTNITFPPGSKRQLYNVTIVDDNIPENSEFFAADIVSISSPGFIIGSTKKPLIEILDFIDVDISADFSARQYEIEEGGQLSIYLSVTYLTSFIPDFTGSIEVEIIAEDLNAAFGNDYLVNLQNPSSRTFTVTFQPKQLNLTEHVISISDDAIFEDKEHFRLRIRALRFIGGAANRFRVQPGVISSFAEVAIKDNDEILVNWTVSDTITVTEGEGVTVELFGEAFGPYANPITIGVVCAETVSTNVKSAFPGRDFNFTPGTKLYFTDVETHKSSSSNSVMISIINDDIAEPCESFICTLQGGALDAVRDIEPNRVTIEICDDDPLIFHWAQDVYEYSEIDIIATVELVTDSKFEVTQVVIQGFPRQIPDGHPNRLPNLVVPGLVVQGFAFDATIEQAFYYLRDQSFGNAQVIKSGRTDVVNTIDDFIFISASNSAFTNFTIVDDDVLEFDELFIAEFSFGPEIANTWNAMNPSTTFILIRDDDSVVVNFNEDSYTAAESDGQISLSFRIDGKFFVPVWAIVEIIDGTATDPEDFSSAKRYNVTFRQTALTDRDDPAPTTVSSPIFSNITDDDLFEGLEYFQARIVETSDRFRVRIGQDAINVTITDSVTVQYEEELYSVEEEAGYVTLGLVLDGEASVPVTVTVRTLDLLNSSVGGAATAQVDYIPKGHVEISFPPGSRRQLYNVNIVHDDIPEDSEYFNVNIINASPKEVTIGNLNRTLIEIQNNNRPRIVTPPEDLQVVNGATVTYNCFATAKTPHSLTWYFISANGSNSTIGSVNGTEKLANSGKYQITETKTSPDEYGRLLIQDVQFEDRGTYLCCAENRHGVDTASATLSVQVPPMFLSTSHQVEVAINSNNPVALKCSLQGYPLSVLQWRKDGTSLSPDDSHINITYFRRQNPMSAYPFSSALGRNFQVIPLESLEYFEAVSELTLVPPIMRTDTANYTCEVESHFVQNYTVTSDHISVKVSESTTIQLYLRSVSDCLTWVETNGDAKLSDISAALSVPLQQQCGCSLSVQQSHFSCFGSTDSQMVVFLAELSYTALPGVDMSSLLTSWVTSTPHIIVASTQMQVDPTCPVVIDSLEPESCLVASMAPPTDVTVVVVAVVFTVLFVVVTLVVATVIAVALFCRKHSTKYRLNRPLPNPVYEDEYTNKGGMALFNMTSNPSYMTANEVVSTRFAPGTEEDKEADHTYEVLPFETDEEGYKGTAQGGQGEVADNGQEATLADV